LGVGGAEEIVCVARTAEWVAILASDLLLNHLVNWQFNLFGFFQVGLPFALIVERRVVFHAVVNYFRIRSRPVLHLVLLVLFREQWIDCGNSFEFSVLLDEPGPFSTENLLDSRAW